MERISDFPAMKDIRERVINAICGLYRHDPELLDVNANERSITHKLAEYLQREFPNWHVDCEYNRLGGDTKRLQIRSIGEPNVEDTEAKTVFPDIIVHHRKTEENLLVMEVKKASGRANTGDLVKLRAFTKSPEYKYPYGLFLKLESKCCHLELYQEGEYRASWTEYLDALGCK